MDPPMDPPLACERARSYPDSVDTVMYPGLSGSTPDSHSPLQQSPGRRLEAD